MSKQYVNVWAYLPENTKISLIQDTILTAHFQILAGSRQIRIKQSLSAKISVSRSGAEAKRRSVATVSQVKYG